jgi:WXG100 family type VII secretion target
MTDQLNVHFGAMSTAADAVRSTHNALVQEKEGLDTFLMKLRGTWHGGAAGNWGTVQNEWNGACDETNAILLSLFNALEIALGNYVGTEHALEQLWGG